MTSTNDSMARARAARLARAAGATGRSEGSEPLSETQHPSETRRLSQTTAGDMLARARAERGATPLSSIEGNLRRSSDVHEGDAIAQADRASLASWSAAPDAALAALEGVAGATDKLARARAAREAREEAAAKKPPGPLRRQSGGETVTNLETSPTLSRVQAVRSNTAQPQQGPPPETAPGQSPPETGTNRWELSLNKAVSSDFELASPAAWFSGSGQPRAPTLALLLTPTRPAISHRPPTLPLAPTPTPNPTLTPNP